MLDTLKRHLRYTSWPILAAMAALMVIGVSAIHVSESAEGTEGLMSRQIVFACAGLLVFVGMTVVPYSQLGRLAYVLFGLTLVMLVVVFAPTPLTAPRKGAYRWIGTQELSIQPSEVAKIAYIVLLAWYLRRGDRYRRLRGLIVPFVLTLLPMVLILKEPDLGTSLLFLPTLYFMLFMAGAKLRHLLSIVALGTVFVFLPIPRKVSPKWNPGEVLDRKALAYWTFQRNGEEHIVAAAPVALMEQHQVSRIVGWLAQSDPRVLMGKGYQLHQSKIVLGSGKLSGSSDWSDSELYFRMLPDDHTDFIFSIVGGQWGFLGSAAVLFLYGVIFVFGVEIAVITYDPFGRLLAVGVLALLFSQIVINVGMTMGLMPITGMTLPLVSYGGSSLVVNCAALGLLVNVGQRRPILLSKRPFEHGDRKEKPPAPYSPLADGAWKRGISEPERDRRSQ